MGATKKKQAREVQQRRLEQHWTSAEGKRSMKCSRRGRGARRAAEEVRTVECSRGGSE